MTRQPLRFRISNWSQLADCKSNNSSELFIRVTNFIQDCRLSGTRIRVEHKVFGVLFACVVNAKGGIISNQDDGHTVFELTPAQILAELAKYGFLVDYSPVKALPGDQLQYLMTLRDLHFDKLRYVSVWDIVNGQKQFISYVVAFKAEENGDWLNNGYSPSRLEYITALENGSALNVSNISASKNYNWSWLVGFVANIDDVVRDNAEV